MKYLVSVIIPCYNVEKWIEKTLNTVFQQTYPFIEIIVVNDGSTDGSLSIIEKCKNENTQYPFYIISTENQGVSAALEIGRNLAKGDFFQYLDSDDILFDKTKIAYQVHELVKNKADVAFCDYEELYPNGERKQGRYAKTLSNRPDADFIRRFWRPTACFLFSRQIVEKAGNWNIDFKAFNEVNYYLQVAILKPTFIHTPHLLVLYVVRQDSLSRKGGLITYFSDYYQLLSYFNTKWESHNLLDDTLKVELIEAFRDCAKAFVGKEKEKFEACIRQIYALNPHYIPKKSLKMRLLSQLVGYKYAEIIAGYWRQIIRFFVILLLFVCL
jgi:glycosyltransferase involved in cell wall biosynthesis